MTWHLTDSSFCQFSGVSREDEGYLHAMGIASVEALSRYLVSHGSWSLVKRLKPQIELFRQARQLELTDTIVNMFPVGVKSRVVSDRYEKTLFFDVETDGIGPRAKITLIATMINGVERTFVRGADLNEFLGLWQDADVIVSFNGKCFDVPVLMHEFGISRIPAHVDLMDEGRYYGLKGGLKDIEKRIGFCRAESSCRTGFDAVRLWQNYTMTGDKELLESLKAYNLDDVRSLVALYKYLLPLATEEVFGL